MDLVSSAGSLGYRSSSGLKLSAFQWPGFKDLTVNFIPGAKPELVCFAGDDEECGVRCLSYSPFGPSISCQVERVDLQSMKTAELHQLMKDRGRVTCTFPRPVPFPQR